MYKLVKLKPALPNCFSEWISYCFNWNSVRELNFKQTLLTLCRLELKSYILLRVGLSLSLSLFLSTKFEGWFSAKPDISYFLGCIFYLNCDFQLYAPRIYRSLSMCLLFGFSSFFVRFHWFLNTFFWSLTNDRKKPFLEKKKLKSNNWKWKIFWNQIL